MKSFKSKMNYIRLAQGPQIYSTPKKYIDLSAVPLQKCTCGGKKEFFKTTLQKKIYQQHLKNLHVVKKT